MTQIKKLTNLENLCNAIYQEDKTNSLDFIREKVNAWFVLGYEIWIDGECKGWAYSLKTEEGLYTLDGHNFGVSVFLASKAGKMVIDDLFEKHTDLVVTAHKTKDKNLNALAKRVGFKWMCEYGDKTLFYRVK